MKGTNTCNKSVKEFPAAGRIFTKKWKISNFVCRVPNPVPIEVKFSTAKRTQMPLGDAKFHMNRCNESPLLGENTDFRPRSKNNPHNPPLRQTCL